ncbi:GGDEF domain-containing protein [Fibrobacter sp. UBA4309]|uniref:GGDEF domain-containing protein n=1 Tax=Fibrobacter sp. UBA4309 TaxID=1946537 RepID=UPI0025C60A07|nr:GGDEF domain-containing protein [Fibrobacter sp. UBA4309]
MHSVLYFELVAFCIVVEVMMFVKMRFGLYRLLYQRTFRNVLVLSALSMGLDYLRLVLDGSMLLGGMLTPLVVTAYFMATAAMSFSWFRYSGFILKFPFWNDRKKLALYGIPLVFVLLLCVSSVWNGLIFFVDDFNFFHRNLLYYIIYVPVCVLYMVTCVALAVRKAMRKRYYAERETNASVASFGVILVTAGILQVYLEDMLPIWSAGIMLASVLAFVLAQSQLISMDPLTRLNNRNLLNQFLNSKMNGKELPKRLYLFVMDLDKFKSINDIYGHSEGDRALVLVADVLKAVCGPRGCFIARFGGDEFNIVAELDNDAAAEALCTAIKDALKERAANLAYKLSLSIGYADHYTGAESLPDFFARADERLYAQKKANR